MGVLRSLPVQIALGILLALLIVMFFRALPGAIEENREHSAHERLKGITPDIVIARCGKPLRDTVDHFGVLRRMYYKARIGGFIILDFAHGQEPEWTLTSADGATSLDGMTYRHYDTAADKVYELPCLANQ